jgi:hypothetical protein
MGIRRSSSLLLLSILLVSCFVVQAHATSTWSIQTVDTNATSGGGVIALDSNNNPHICYTDYENGNYHNPIYLMYASWSDSGWNIQTVTAGRGTIDLALDSSNNPHLLYNDDPTGSRLMYASWTGSNWSIQTVDNEGVSGSLALDSTGNPHIAYTGYGNPTNPQVLKYASWTGSNWSIQTVVSEGFTDIGNLALDSNNYPHILYGYDTPGPYDVSTIVKYAVWNGSSWNTQIVFSDVLGFGNMALDSNGYPHFTYIKGYPEFTYNNVTLTYASWNGSAWNTQTVASNIDWGGLGGGFLSLDSDNHPHIDYYTQALNSESGTLMYARWTGKSWDIQTVDSNSLAIGAGPIAVDSNGNPYMCYCGLPSGQPLWYSAYLMYATLTEFTQTLTPSPNQILGITLLVSLLLVVSIALILKKRATRKTR